jgi:hypothetical protein
MSLGPASLRHGCVLLRCTVQPAARTCKQSDHPIAVRPLTAAYSRRMPGRIAPSTQPGSERESLEAWLEFHRATLLMKCQGLTPEQLVTASCPPSRLSLMGLVRHLTGVEPWFHDFDGEPDMEMFEGEEMFEPSVEHVERDLANYRRSVERAQAAAAAHELDDVVAMPHWVADDQPREVRPTSLRWVYQHMIEEYARHNGHADLIRERIDGTVGD